MMRNTKTNRKPSACCSVIAVAFMMFTATATSSQVFASACPSADYAADSIEARLAEATTGMGIQFMQSLKDKAGENVVISPLSLMNILNMLLLGADDNSSTQQELINVLGYGGGGGANQSLAASGGDPNNRLRVHEAARNICIVDQNATGANQQAVNFTLANLLLANQDLIELKQDYEKELALYYRVKVENFTRVAAANVSREMPLHERVNLWVKNQTQGQIEQLAEESDLSSNDLVMVLLNAAFFKARWLHTFNVKATQDRTFYNLGRETADVKFMSQKGTFGYADFNTNASQLDVSMPSSDSKTRTSEDEETLLTEDVPTKPPAAAAASNETSSAPAAATSGQPQSSATASVAPPPPEKLQPPVIELSKEEARRLELTAKLNCSALMLPFSLNDGQDLSMVILLPARRDGLGELMANLNAVSLNEIYRSLTEQTVKIELPKFQFESSHDARETLKSMGLQSIFSESAQLSRMYRLAGSSSSSTNNSSDRAPIKVDKVIHKVKIGVDESGAQAAAASMVTLDLRNFVRPQTPSFVADHPFLFIIRHNRSNMPLFMGQVNRL